MTCRGMSFYINRLVEKRDLSFLLGGGGSLLGICFKGFVGSIFSNFECLIYTEKKKEKGICLLHLF